MSSGWWRTADEMAAEFRRRFAARSDSDFLADCGVIGDPDAERAALAVRRSVARYGAITPEHIYASHSYPGELESLSNWDSLDFIGWALELELELGIKVQRGWFDLLPQPFSVYDLVLAVQRHLGDQTPPQKEPN